MRTKLTKFTILCYACTSPDTLFYQEWIGKVLGKTRDKNYVSSINYETLSKQFRIL